MPLNPAWKSLAQLVPDARAKRSVGEKQHRLLGMMERVYCVNCGADGGMVTKEWASHIFHLCDECVVTYGPPAGAFEIPDQSAPRDPLSRPPDTSLLIK